MREWNWCGGLEGEDDDGGRDHEGKGWTMTDNMKVAGVMVAGREEGDYGGKGVCGLAAVATEIVSGGVVMMMMMAGEVSVEVVHETSQGKTKNIYHVINVLMNWRLRRRRGNGA
ncbi:hypothetical protein Pmani_028804 [Petrolisthes manimaculis]|uniref:Uncharacterized protein n=1 Tax=Petrolisthes manimaculis TaxID=1843537 RepID=A0AAE1TXM7_9EUCA|nr:hypothetical protein Pmani_028804 [Petrolisthes manimaculis]